MILADTLAEKFGYNREKMRVVAIDDSFGYGAKNEDIYKTLGISAEDVEREITKLIREA